MGNNKIHIGTSGWHYKHWKGTFYPDDIKQHQQLEFYLKYFKTVEINNSFYRLPSPDTFLAWKNAVDQDFIFSVKASRYITHMKKLKDPMESIASFFENVNFLGEKLGPILFQLPPFWQLNLSRFQEFIENLPSGYQFTFEFRNPSWYNNHVYDLLKKHNCAFCIYEIDRHLSPAEITADFVYVRLHGPERKYEGSYSDSQLSEWASQCISWAKAGKQVYIYFDNDQFGFAAFNAKTLLEMIENETIKK